MKKILAFIAAVAMVFSVAVCPVAALRGNWNGVIWEIDDGVLTVTGGNIPDCSASSAAPWMKFASDVTSVTVGDGVSGIGERAFEDMTSVVSVSFGKTVTVGKMAFSGCTSLKTAVLPETVKNLCDSAFAECRSLEKVSLPGSLTFIGEAVFEGCVSLAEISSASERYPSVGGVLTNAQKGSILRYPPAKKTISYDIPEGISVIAAGAFRDSFNIVSVNLDGVETVGDGAFYGCTALENVRFEDVASIGRAAFYGCTSLGEVSFGKALRTVGEDAFRDCPALSVARFDGDAPDAKEGVFYGAGNGFVVMVGNDSEGFGDTWLGYPVVRDGIYSGDVGSIAWSLDTDSGVITLTGEGEIPDFEYPADAPWYSYRKLIREISVDGVTAVGKNSFRYSAVTELVLPDSVVKIGEYAFSGCESLTGVTARGVTVIGDCAFFGDIGLRGADIDKTEVIGGKAFSGCEALYWIFLGDNAPEVGEYAFDDAAPAVIYSGGGEEYTGELWDSFYCEKYLPGDASGDGKFNLSDVSLMLKNIARWDVDIKKISADTNLDGKVNISDASVMLKRLAKWTDVPMGITR